ncbi:hypothetical protein LARI1_G008274 [Lachnellula arida]|uniref:Protein NO VEIN C-terminal domain-containing protein n=1 Tax=Lachnellula arida TaxID=1316785 RepID=A0A8T9B8Q5_9HELO|nr:hypothetical protein LARI1_G008274 [Lachnellula arida]
MATNDVISSTEARQLVESIALGYGWISQTVRDATHPDALKAIYILQENLGISVSTLATNLYKSQARFVFELIQNAEDNSYKTATSNGAVPYIEFTIHPNKIVIDSNEDGFTTANVQAICKIGQSTKKREGVQQFIGEKGIGFKSVFMVASKVHIQSGPFSFSFEDSPEKLDIQTGINVANISSEQLAARRMGLVTPIWEPAEADLPDPLTRMTLTLKDKLSYPKLLSQFDALPDTFLLFLNQLGAIKITRSDGKTTESTTFSRTLDESSRQAILSKAQRIGSEVLQPSLKHYHITRRMLTNLSPDERRDRNSAEVVLAFPLEDDKPIIVDQETYAYLPMGNFGFSFLIQSDFVTEGSREGVMEDNRRNNDILDGVAETFLDAVLQFCKHPTLQYKWPRYIPQTIPNPFWRRIKEKIHQLLKERAVLRGQSQGPLWPIRQLKKIVEQFQDEFDDPLVADLDEEVYLSSEYQKEDIAALDKLGLEFIDFGAILARFKCDLGRGTDQSKFKSNRTTDYWHNKTAKLLLLPFEKKWKSSTLDKVRELPCIPLESGEWTAIINGAVYFPRAKGILIPTDLGLRILDEKSFKDPIREKLFLALGVDPAKIQDIRALVLERYNKAASSITFETSLNDLQFLYLAYSPGSTVQLRKSTSLFVFNHLGRRIQDEEDLYFQSDEEYSFEKLMGSVLETAPYNNGLVGSFIHPNYLKRIELPHAKRAESHPTLKTWLQRSIGVLSHPRLADPQDSTQLSPIFHHIIKECPENMLGTLKAYWVSYAAVMNGDLASKISEAVVPNTNIGSKPLKETFLHSETLTINCGKFVDVQKFPFLRLENGTDIKGWKFLNAFHVGIEDNLDFWLQVLYYCKFSKAEFRYEIYEVIQKKIWTSDSPNEDVQKVRNFINNEELILAPSRLEGLPSWTCQVNCFWDAPDYLITTIPLLPYLSRFNTTNTTVLTAFFQETLDIPDVSWGNLTDELDKRQMENLQDMKINQDIYLRLQKMSADMDSEELESLRADFETRALVYDMQGQRWTTPSACLWSKDAQVPGKSTISSQYPNLKDLFVGVLKVKIPDLRLLVQELKRVARSSPSIDDIKTIDDIKSLIWQINAFAPTIEDLTQLRESKIFPVKKSIRTVELQTRLETRLERFSIIDRQPWADAFADEFEGELDVLDFSLKQVRSLEPFLSSMQVGGYLSEVVIEKSSFEGSLPEPNPKRTRDFQRRAYALSRCATHFDSPRAKNDNQDLYQLLLKSKVYETDGVTGSLEHTLLGVTIKFCETKLHIEECPEGLQIYVPKNSRDQEICYLRLLPTKLFNETMMVEVDTNSTAALDSGAVSIISAIFASSDNVVDLLLEEAGIVPVSYPDQYEKEFQQSLDYIGADHEQNAENDIETLTSEMQSGTASAGLDTPSAQSTTPSNAATSTYRASYQLNVPSQPIQPSNYPTAISQPNLSNRAPRQFTPESSDVEYRRLLNNIITAARNKRGAFPSRGAFNLDQLLNALPVEAAEEVNTYDLPFGVRNENQLAHDMKIGAAGELYAFEILSRLETTLPEFGHHNWKSTIRKFVKVHEKYQGMKEWTGSETADITYNDKEGEFTQLLVANGYLVGSIWAAAKPKYFLEVKTTTKECATKLFLSKSQYRRMQGMKLGAHASDEVYIILRVFNLDKENIDMRLYVDPAGMEDRELKFTPESYSVVPLVSDGR